jgi:tyrosyl-tRNA synthetase
MEGVPSVETGKDKLLNDDIVTLLTETKIFPSKGEARKMLTGGGVFINKEKVIKPDDKVNAANLLHDKYLLVQKGKKNYYLVKAV